MLFSILIPLYNNKEYIEECIESILGQNESDYEIIIIDDGSTDGGGEIAERLSKSNKHIKVIHQNNRGLFHTRIVAINESKGKYLIFLDSDDTLAEGALTVLKNEVNDNSLDMIIYKFQKVGPSGKAKPEKKLFDHNTVFTDVNKKELYRKIIEGSSLNSICIKLIKKECFSVEQLIKLPKITMGEDLVHTLYPLTNASKVKYIDKALYNYRTNEKSMSYSFYTDAYKNSKVIHQMLFTYLYKWGMETYKLKSELYVRFLKNVSGIVLFSRANIDGKEKEYKMVLESIAKDEMFYEATKYKRSLPFIYKVPIYLLLNKKNKMLFFLKKTVSKLRR